MKIAMYLEEGADPNQKCSKCETPRTQCLQFHFMDLHRLCELCYGIYIGWDETYTKLEEFLKDDYGGSGTFRVAKSIIAARRRRANPNGGP